MTKDYFYLVLFVSVILIAEELKSRKFRKEVETKKLDG